MNKERDLRREAIQMAIPSLWVAMIQYGLIVSDYRWYPRYFVFFPKVIWIAVTAVMVVWWVKWAIELIKRCRTS